MWVTNVAANKFKKYGTVSLVCVDVCVAIKTFEKADTKLGIKVACISVELQNRAREDRMESVYQKTWPYNSSPSEMNKRKPVLRALLTRIILSS